MAPRPKSTAREIEQRAASVRDRSPAVFKVGSEVSSMLARRGVLGAPVRLDLPFDEGISGDQFERLLTHLGRYAFRLFLRGAIQRGGGFAPEEATRYLSLPRATELAEASVDLGILERAGEGRYRLIRAPKSFGSTLEWYIARELERRLGFDVAVGLTFPAPGVGGDLDIVAAAEGVLVYIEAKSSPPKHIAPPEVAAFVGRVRALRPHIAIFAVDTALRLADKVIPMIEGEIERGGRAELKARRVEREVWAFGGHVYVVNARPDLIANISRAIAEGLFALSPEPV
ncbi:MAG TPA: hypothetical protein VK459_03925 [Polyangiaceae bacterium]|nr:hypothetical protein [Polyangiaceae bacterium]